MLVEIPFGLIVDTDSWRGRMLSTIECVEFCLPLGATGRTPFVGGGDIRPRDFGSGKVLRMGEEAMDGDMADVTVLFLSIISMRNLLTS